MLTNLLTTPLPEGGRYVPISEALLYAVIGFLVVFAGIALLIFVVWAVGKLMGRVNGKVKSSEKPVQKIVPTPIAKANVETDEISEETVAVITAALMAYYESNNSKCEFIVKRIKRI